jgi:hypothetical protein
VAAGRFRHARHLGQEDVAATWGRSTIHRLRAGRVDYRPARSLAPAGTYPPCSAALELGTLRGLLDALEGRTFSPTAPAPGIEVP